MGRGSALVSILLVASCQRQPVVPAVVPPAATVEAPADPGAFIVYLANEQTVVIPTSGRGEVLVNGIWLPTPESALRYGVIEDAPLDETALLLDVCVDGDMSCDVEAPMQVVFSRGLDLLGEGGTPCSCVYVAGVSDDQPFDWGGEDMEDEDEDDYDDCEPEALGVPVGSPELLSVEAGTLHFEELTYTGECAAGMSDWEATSVEVEVVSSYPSKPMLAPRPSTCSDAGISGMDNDTREPPGGCGGPVEYSRLLSGNRVRVGVMVSGNSGITSCCAEVEPLSPQTCPSAVDPCGRLGAQEEEPVSDYWVATDGSFLLVRTSAGLEVSGLRGAERRRFSVELPENAEIVGVHHLDHASAYLGVVRTNPRWRFVSPDEAVEFRTLKRTADYIERVERLIVAGKLRGAWRAGLAGLAFEHNEAINNFGTHYQERGELLRLLERVATALGRPEAAASLHQRADVLRHRAEDPFRYAPAR